MDDSDRRCATCHWWCASFSGGDHRACVRISGVKDAPVRGFDGLLVTSADFGCVLWEPDKRRAAQVRLYEENQQLREENERLKRDAKFLFSKWVLPLTPSRNFNEEEEYEQMERKYGEGE